MPSPFEHPLGCQALDRAAVVPHVAPARLQVAVDGAQERRLAGAVRADDHGDQAVARDQVDALQDRHLARVARDDVPHLGTHRVVALAASACRPRAALRTRRCAAFTDRASDDAGSSSVDPLSARAASRHPTHRAARPAQLYDAI